MDYTYWNYGVYHAKTSLWAQNIQVSLQVPCHEENLDELKKCEPAALDWIDWLQNNRAAIETALIEGVPDKDGNMQTSIFSLAQDWVCDEKEAEDKNGYVMVNGHRVDIPIAPQDFLDSLNMMELGLNFFEEGQERAELYFACKPDYFAGHAVLVAVGRESPEAQRIIRMATLEG